MVRTRAWVTVVVGCVSSLANAQPAPSPAPQDPPPAPEPGQSPPTDPNAPVVDDTALAGLFATIFSPWATPDARRAAVEHPLLTDPRAVPPLSFLLQRDRDPAVRAAAAFALGRMPYDTFDRRGEQALLATARSPVEASEVRLAAIEALRWVGSDEVATPLRELYTSATEPEQIRAAAKAALAARWPAELEKRVPVVDDRSGRSLLIAGGTLLGSFTLGAVGALGRNDAGTVIGVLGGAVTGGITASYLTRSGEITKAQASWMVSAGVWGAGIGMTTAGSFQRDPDHRFVLSLGLIGEGIAFGAAYATRRSMTYSSSDIAETNGIGLLAVDLALGGLLIADPASSRTWLGTVTLASVAGLASGLVLSPTLRFSDRDSSLVALGAYEGLWLGSLAPTAWFSPVDDAHDGAGALLGVGFGILGTAALAQITEVPKRTSGLMWLMGTYGKLLGYSLPLLTRDDDVSDARGVFVGSVAGLAGGAVVADHLKLSAGDGTLIALGTIVGGWHGLGLGIAAGYDDRKLGGLTLLGTSVGGLASIGASQAIKLETTDVQALAGGLFWGTWFSAWGAALADMELEPALRLTVYAGDAGLALSGLLVSPAIDLDPRRLGVAYLGGVSGAALASLGAALATRDNDTLITANLIGSAAGLAVGALVGSRMKMSPRRPRGAAVAAASGTSDRSWLRAPVVSPMIVPPSPGSGAAPGFGLTATFIP